MKDGGWLVRVELEAGRGELEPIVYVVALHDHRYALEAARSAPKVVRVQEVLGGRAASIHNVELVAPVDARTIEMLKLGVGELWDVYDPPPTDRIDVSPRR